MKRILLLIFCSFFVHLINGQRKYVSSIKFDYETYKKKAASYGIRRYSLLNTNDATSDDENRKELYAINLEKINSHNMKYNEGMVNYELGVNQFTDWTDFEFMDYVKSGGVKELTFKTFRPNNRTKIRASYKMDWRNNRIVTSVKNQGTLCNSCTVFSAVAAIESHYAKLTNELVSFSEQYLIDCGDNKMICKSGGHATDQFDFLFKNNKTGLPTDKMYPFRLNSTETKCVETKIEYKFRVVDYIEVQPINLISVLSEIGPIIVNIHGSDSKFKDYKGGILDDYPRCNTSIDHSVLLIGYDKDSFILKNSWGDWWGENGYFRISRKICEFYKPFPIYPDIEIINAN